MQESRGQAAVEAALVEVGTGAAPGYGLTTKFLPRRCQKDAAVYNPAFSSIAFVIGLGFIFVRPFSSLEDGWGAECGCVGR